MNTSDKGRRSGVIERGYNTPKSPNEEFLP